MSEWISVTERMPADGAAVLVRGKDSRFSYESDYQAGMEIARFQFGEWVTGKQETPLDGVTHWQPLPPL